MSIIATNRFRFVTLGCPPYVSTVLSFLTGLCILMFHRAFFNSIIDKQTHALHIQQYISLEC